jgi:hypothetical protein
MSESFRSGAFIVGLWIVTLILLASCGSSDPTGPQVKVEGNTAPVTVIVPSGDNSAGGTAPCAATTVSNTSNSCPITTTTNTDNGTTVAAPVVAPTTAPVAAIP